MRAAAGPSLKSSSSKAIVKAFGAATPASFMAATTSALSTPPDRNAPSGTSLNRRSRTEFSSSDCSSSARSSSARDASDASGTMLRKSQ